MGGTPMIEFLHTYGLWIALAGVFFALHRFGIGCCGGQQQRPERRAQGPGGTNLKDERASAETAKSNEISH